MKAVFLALYLFSAFVAAVHREYYDLLELQPSASQNEIKKAYKKLSVQYHPDRNPDHSSTEKFAKIANAYEVLSDPEKRRKYDQLGPDFEKLSQQQHHGHPFGDFFGHFGRQQQQERRGPELVMKIHVTLEDIYNGKEIGVMNTKKIICPHCRGSGADDPDHIRQCPDCGGQGMIIRRHQVGPGFWQQVQQPCDKCRGKGKIYTSTCHVCRGAKTIPGMNRFTLYIEKGVKHGQKLNFPNEGSEYEDMAASNLAFLVIETPHSRFRRDGDNLHTTVEINLREALLGFTKTITHLDGHKVEIKRAKVTQPGDIDRLANEGMPQFGYSSYHGELIVEYKVKLPERLSDESGKAWDEALKVTGI